MFKRRVLFKGMIALLLLFAISAVAKASVDTVAPEDEQYVTGLKKKLLKKGRYRTAKVEVARVECYDKAKEGSFGEVFFQIPSKEETNSNSVKSIGVTNRKLCAQASDDFATYPYARIHYRKGKKGALRMAGYNIIGQKNLVGNSNKYPEKKKVAGRQTASLKKAPLVRKKPPVRVKSKLLTD